MPLACETGMRMTDPRSLETINNAPANGRNLSVLLVEDSRLLTDRL